MNLYEDRVFILEYCCSGWHCRNYLARFLWHLAPIHVHIAQIFSHLR